MQVFITGVSKTTFNQFQFRLPLLQPYDSKIMSKLNKDDVVVIVPFHYSKTWEYCNSQGWKVFILYNEYNWFLEERICESLANEYSYLNLTKVQTYGREDLIVLHAVDKPCCYVVAYDETLSVNFVVGLI